jgi:hypothetical protein
MAAPLLLDVMSRGSINHTTLSCRPCVHNANSKPCPRGEQCNFCHFGHDQDKIDEAAAFSAEKRQRHHNKKGKLSRQNRQVEEDLKQDVLAPMAKVKLCLADTFMTSGDTAHLVQREQVRGIEAKLKPYHDVDKDMMQLVQRIWPCIMRETNTELSSVLQDFAPIHYDD